MLDREKLRNEFREYINESSTLYKVEFIDPMGNKKVLSSNCKIVNSSGVSKSITDLSYIVNGAEVEKETGNVGDKHYTEYLTKRIKEAGGKSKNNITFAKELNKIFKTNIFKAV